MFSSNQDKGQATSLIEQKVASIQEFVKRFGVELWTKPGTVGFYFPVAEKTHQVTSVIKKNSKKKLTTIQEASGENNLTNSMKAATLMRESQI